MLATGFPVAIKPSDDHKAHISVLFAFNQAAQMRQQPVDQSAVQVLMDHLQQHLAALEQTDPNTSRAIQKHLRDVAAAQMKQQEQAMQPQPQVI
jgi:tRNA C32,U32 (ribose-2'-O)-methylase TrmJ